MKGLVIFAVMAIISVSWWPSHQIFKWLRKIHYSILTTVLAISVCTIISALLIVVGYTIGQHIHNLSIRSLGSEAAGEPSSLNLFWFPFAWLGLGVWAGFLSGYVRMKIIDNSKM